MQIPCMKFDQTIVISKMMDYLFRRDSSTPYQAWNVFPPEAIVQVENAFGDSRIAVAGSLWWGYGQELGSLSEGVIVKARRLDKKK